MPSNPSQDSSKKLPKKISAEQQKLIRERAQKAQIRRSLQIGQLAHRAGLSGLEDQVLLGGLLTLREHMHNAEVLAKWKEQGLAFQKPVKVLRAPLIIQFSGEIEPPKEKLKELKFQWNRFRKEWYGYGDKQAIEQSLSDYRPRIFAVE